MDRQSHQRATVDFYETHPISEDQILETLRAEGHDPDALTEDVLQAYDQDHYGGTAAVDALARAADIGAGSRVLDVCSGMGGPARYLAHAYGCRVSGIDFTASRVEGATRLSARVGLQDRVDFRRADAQENPFADAAFDVVIGQEAWCHVPDKPRLIAECVRVTRPGGVVAFTDVVRLAATTEDVLERLRQGLAMIELATADEYGGLFEDLGCSVERADDMSREWAAILARRLAMYRDLKAQTVARFGAAHYRRWDAVYAFFVGLFEDRRLGGVRMVARRRV